MKALDTIVLLGVVALDSSLGPFVTISEIPLLLFNSPPG